MCIHYAWDFLFFYIIMISACLIFSKRYLKLGGLVSACKLYRYKCSGLGYDFSVKAVTLLQAHRQPCQSKDGRTPVQLFLFMLRNKLHQDKHFHTSANGPGLRRTGVYSQLCHTPAGWPYTSHFLSLCLGVLICKTEATTVTSFQKALRYLLIKAPWKSGVLEFF